MDEVYKAIAMLLNIAQSDLSKLSVEKLLELRSICREWQGLARDALIEELQDGEQKRPSHDN